jgi:hypothetical protein
MSNSHPFVLGQTYTRTEIQAALGGSAIHFLPHENDRVLCGCFRKDYNPEAPHVVIPGSGPIIEHSARLFCSQDYAIPIFLRQRANFWEYIGDFKAEKSSTDRKMIESHHCGSRTPLHKITRVIFLKRV